MSNFYGSSLVFEGKIYKTVEHAYQASKTLDVDVREFVRKAKSPAEAKKLGQSIPLRPDWYDVRVDIMRLLIKEKFENPFLRPLLLETEDAELILNNKWNDKFWGVCRGEGENWLGRILMEERKRIKEEDSL